MKTLQPVNQNVLLELENANEIKQTSAGIYLPDTAVERQNIATVVGISVMDQAEVAIGDKVWYKPFSGTETEFEGKKYLLLPYADILAKIVESEEI